MDAILGEVRLFAGGFPPEGWAVCNGQSLPISEHPELFSLLGTVHGGDGVKAFAVPDMSGETTGKGGRIPVHVGAGPGLSINALGTSAGAETGAMTIGAMWPHTHAFQATTNPADRESPEGAVLAKAPTGRLYYSPPPGAGVTQVAMHSGSVQPAGGGGKPFALGMPTVGVLHIICLRGAFPDLPNPD